MVMLTLAATIESRDTTLAKDSKLMNCYWENDSGGKRMVIKRFGLQAIGPTVLPSTTFPYCQGLVAFDTYNFAITQDTLQQIITSGVPSIPFPAPPVAGQRMFSLSNTMLSTGAKISLIQSASALWILSSTTSLTKVTNANYPTAAVPGVVFLEGTYYVMTTAGAIQGSALEDPSTWTALNFISTDRGLGPPVALSRHLNYVAAFCERGIQFFYNAANPAPGSPLLPSGNTVSTVGCYDAYSIHVTGDRLIFLAIDRGHRVSLMAFNGLSLTTLSTPAVERLLGNNQPSLGNTSMVLTMNGHLFYVLTLMTSGITLVLDLTTGDWSQWSSSSDGLTDSMFRGALSTTAAAYTSAVVLDRTTGGVYNMNSAYSDVGSYLRCLIRTRGLDHDSSARKFLSRINLAGDDSVSQIQVRYSDDDCATWSAYRTIDMSGKRKQLVRLGSFYKRTFEFLTVDNVALRLEGLILPDEAAPAQMAPDQE